LLGQIANQPVSQIMSQRVLFLEGNIDGTVGGSYYVMFDLVMGLDRNRYHPVVGFHQDNFLAGELRDRGVEVIIFPTQPNFSFKSATLNRVLAPVKKLINLNRQVVKAAAAQTRFLRENRIDLLNLNNSIRSNHSWMLAAKRCQVPCITHEMGINFRYSRISKYFGRRLNGIICVSHAIEDAMRKGGALFPNTTVIHCGIDLNRYVHQDSPQVLRQRHDIPDDAKIIGVVGNIREWKGQETVVRAIPGLLERHQDLYCVLVGETGESDKEYRQKLDQLCLQSGISERVKFTGFQRNPIDYMQLMDVVLHTSIHPEPFGIVTLEAMSIAKPLISTTIGGPAEVVVDGETGILIEPGRPDLMVTAIDSMLADPENAKLMGEKGQQRLHEHFRLEDNINKTMDVYDGVLELTFSDDRNPNPASI